MNAHAQSIAVTTCLPVDLVSKNERAPSCPRSEGIAFGMLLASLYAAQGAVGSLDSAFSFIRRAADDGAGSALDIPTLKLLSERLTGLAAAADAAQATIAGRVARGRP